MAMWWDQSIFSRSNDEAEKAAHKVEQPANGDGQLQGLAFADERGMYNTNAFSRGDCCRLHHVGPLAEFLFTLVELKFILALYKADKQAAAMKAAAHPTAYAAIVLSSTKPNDVSETSGRTRQDPSRFINCDENYNDTITIHDDEDGDRHGQTLKVVSSRDRDPTRSKRGPVHLNER
ncbi:hypothetical protein PsorP6_004995 [Peronosclerospora sorghi]|uniref:Uncharacterized protein n=1 Tax=Peronosclerospora sorghi TaxID=230839 RepID=A0ACC0W3Z9_9STRA|nr:hypothetical protein PsorP6_004995 [Peronosclerospora sorghi]